MSAKRQRRRLGNAILLSLAFIVTLGPMATATEGDPIPIPAKGSAVAKGFCEYGPVVQEACGGSGMSGTHSGVQCKGNPYDC